jgi:hypothetical protein
LCHFGGIDFANRAEIDEIIPRDLVFQISLHSDNFVINVTFASSIKSFRTSGIHVLTNNTSEALSSGQIEEQVGRKGQEVQVQEYRGHSKEVSLTSIVEYDSKLPDGEEGNGNEEHDGVLSLKAIVVPANTEQTHEHE